MIVEQEHLNLVSRNRIILCSLEPFNILSIDAWD